MADVITGEAFLAGGIRSKANPAAYKWHQLSKLEKGEAAEKDAEGEKVKLTPLKLVGYCEKVLPNGLWCLHAYGYEGEQTFVFKDKAGKDVEIKYDASKWFDPYEKHRSKDYKSAFANPRDKDKDPKYRAICIACTGSEELGASVAKLVGVGRKASAPYVIDRDGTIYELYDPDEFWGERDGKFDVRTVGVMLVNRGALDNAEQMPGETFRAPTPFRGKEHFHNFTAEQNDAVVALLRYLCARYQTIPKTFRGEPTDLDKLGEYESSKNAREAMSGIYAHSNVREKAFDPGPGFAWPYVIEKVLADKPPEPPKEEPAPAPTENKQEGKFEWPLDVKKYIELADKAGSAFEDRKIKDDDPYAALMRISRRVGLSVEKWDPKLESKRPPFGPFPMYGNGEFNDGVKLGLPPQWGEIAGKLEVKAIADGEVVARGGENAGGVANDLGWTLLMHAAKGGGMFFALYWNLTGMDSTVGDQIAAGDFLGYVGKDPRFPHVHLAIASDERFPAADAPEAEQVFGDEMTLEELKRLGPSKRERAWSVARLLVPSAPKVFEQASLEGECYLYHPLHFIRWLRGEVVDLGIANPPVEAKIEETKTGGRAGGYHEPRFLLQCKPFREETAIQTFFARTVIKKLADLSREEDMLVEGIEQKGMPQLRCVMALQKALIELGYLRAKPDGVFGPRLSAAVKAFEEANKEAMVYSDGTKLEPNGDCDWVTLKAIDTALHAIETRPVEEPPETEDFEATSRYPEPPRDSFPAAGVAKDGDALKLPDKFLWMDGAKEQMVADAPGFMALKTLPVNTPIYCYVDGGKFQLGVVLQEDASRQHFGPGRLGTISPGDFLKVDEEKTLDLPTDVWSVLMAVSQNEQNLDAINFWDRGIVSFGMLRWTLFDGRLIELLSKLKEKDSGSFDTYFGKQGMKLEDKGDKGIELKIDDAVVATSKVKVRVRAGDVRKILTLKWAYLFHAAGLDPKVQKFQIETAVAWFKDAWGGDALKLEDKPLKEWIDSEFGVALVYDMAISAPHMVLHALQDALQSWKLANAGATYDKTNAEHQQGLCWQFVAARCRARMWDPWNRAERIRAIAEQREVAPQGAPMVGNAANWTSVWKPLWDAGGPADPVDANWDFVLSKEPGSFTLEE